MSAGPGIVHGLMKKKDRTWEELSELLRFPVFNKIVATAPAVERMQQLGRKRGVSRSLIKKLFDHREKMEILRNCNKLKRSRISVGEDISWPVRVVRKK